jgi:PAS domain S-box-containing protein
VAKKASAVPGVNSYVAEALRWIPDCREQSVDFPLKEETIENPKAAAEDSQNSAKEECTILLADDNTDMREYLQKLLEKHYRVVAVSNGVEALKVIEKSCPDLILTDVMMPLTDGFGLLRAVRDNPATRSVPAIILSARAGEEARIEGGDAGADDYLVKPFSARELLARVGAQFKLARTRQQADARLRENKERFRAFVNARSDVVYRMSPDWTEMWQLDGRGFISDTEGPKINWIDEYIHPEDQPTVLRAIHNAIQTKSIFELEHRVRQIDGTLGWTLSRAVPISDKNGKIVEWLGAAKNVNARREAEEALRQSEQRLRLITEASPIMVWMSGTDKLCYYFNKTWLEFIGRPLEQELGNGWVQNVHPDDFDRWLRIYVSSFDARCPFQMEYRLRHHSGQYRWILNSAVPRYASDGTFEGYVGCCLDIHEQKEASEVRSRLAAIVESSDNAIISKDLNGIITSWNRRTEHLFGYKEEEMIGRSILTIIPPEFHHDEDMILSKIRNGQKIDHFETVRIAKSGEKLEVSLSISPVRDGQGDIVGAAKIARDIRENKKIERALRTTEKLAAAGRLAATVAHEINNPLEAINNLVFLAKRDAGDANKVSEYLRLAERELGRVAHITRQTLGFYRDTSAPPSRLDVLKTIDDLLFLYEKRFETRNIRIIRQYKDVNEITAFGDEIRQALSNLISNAIDAMPSGGSLVIRVSQSRDWSNSLQPGVRVTILDTGSGIPCHARKSLFEPFFTTKADVGTGLGLWITKNIVEKHRGNIHFVSRTGQQDHGTAFSIFLPFNMPDNAARQPHGENTAGV